MYLLVCLHLMEEYLVAHCNIDFLFVLSGHNIEVSLNLLLLLQSSHALLAQVAKCQIMGMFAAP